MHLARLGLKPLLLLAAALAAVLFVVLNIGSSSRQEANAAGTFDPNGVVCVNIDSPIPPPVTNAVEILIRFDHQKNDGSTTPSNFVLSQQSYVGDTDNNGVPDVSMANCQTKGSAGEPFALPGGVPLANVDPYKRADVKAVVTASPHAIDWSTCAFEAGFGGWIYTEFHFPLSAGQKNFGTVTTGVNNTWVSPTKCTKDLDGNGTNDPPSFAPAARASQRSVENKGTGVVTAAPGAQGGLDWDGDGCTDWVELSPDKNDRRGLDPFNPGDCAAIASGNLSGTFDIQDCTSPNCTATSILYDCISRQDHDMATNYVGTSAVCNDNLGALAGGGALPATDPPGEGHLGDSNAAGPPPPPPYTAADPANGNGRYCPPGGGASCGTGPVAPNDSLVITSCFPNVGGANGPNYVAVVHDGDAFDLATNTGPGQGGPNNDWTVLKYDVARVELYTKQSNGECDTKHPGGTPYTTFNIKVTATSPTGNPLCSPSCVVSAVRTGHAALDYDGDGCNDSVELAKPNPKGKCGDDPFNPLDVSGSCAAGCDVSGPWNLQVTAARANCQRSGANCTIIPGIYYNCVADIQQNVTTLSAAASCYIDSLAFTNNKPGNGGSATCPGNNVTADKFCGDGLIGAAVPGCAQANQVPSAVCLALPNGFTGGVGVNAPSRHDCAGLGTSPDPSVPCDVSQWTDSLLHVDQATILTGTLDTANNQMHFNGCFEDPHGHTAQGAVYVEDATVGIHDGHGFVTIHTNQTNAQCLAHSTTDGLKGTFKFDAVRQPPGSKANGSRDTDSDGCPDKRELQNPVGAQTALDVAKLGGLRDPQNPFDYPDAPIPSNVHKIRVDDVTYVVNRYRHDMNLVPAPGTNVYDPKADHTVIPGNNAGETWHLGPPNGQIRVDDVTAVVNQYRHDCI